VAEKGYRKLKVWQKAHNLAVEIYRTTENFPKEELYGITSQLRRASFSVPLNIVEGQASSSKKEFINFLNIANRSLVEAEYLLETCEELNFLNRIDYEKLERLRSEVGIILNAFVKSVKSKL